MKPFVQQFKFDVQREILRNLPFLFFSLLMPAGFYILFTKVMVSGSQGEVQQFSGSYMCSMIVYSLIISAFFGLAALLQRDRRSGYLTRLSQTPVGLNAYYCSIALCFMLMTVLSTGIMFALAIGLNHFTLRMGQMLLMILVSLIGELPLFVIGLLISHVEREETLSVISNLLTFPVAIVSGLWWPMTMLPQWLQVVGKSLPTYRLNQLLNNIVANQHSSGYDWLIIASWLAVSVSAVLIQDVTLRRWRYGVKE